MAPTPSTGKAEHRRNWLMQIWLMLLLMLLITGGIATIVWAVFLAWALGRMIFALF